MKFQLFGRLKDDDEADTSSSGMDSGLGSTGNSFEDDGMQMGGGLDRTVKKMFSQGYSQEEIKSELVGQYEESKIDGAINNVVANSASGGNMSNDPQPMSRYQGNQETNEMDDSSMDTGFDNQPQQGNTMEPQDNIGGGNMGGNPQPQGNPGNSNVNQGTEELVETIVAENLDQLEREFNNVYEELDQLRQDINDLDQRVHDLEVRDDEDQQQFIKKVDEMEDHVDNYQSRIGGLEKAFQQVLPSLVDNVRDLTDLVQEIKKEKGIETNQKVSKEDINDINVDEW